MGKPPVGKIKRLRRQSLRPCGKVGLVPSVPSSSSLLQYSLVPPSLPPSLVSGLRSFSFSTHADLASQVQAFRACILF